MNFRPVTVLRVGDERLIPWNVTQMGTYLFPLTSIATTEDHSGDVKNAFDVNKNNIFKEERPDDSTLMIIGQHGQ